MVYSGHLYDIENNIYMGISATKGWQKVGKGDPKGWPKCGADIGPMSAMFSQLTNRRRAHLLANIRPMPDQRQPNVIMLFGTGGGVSK